MKNKHRYSHQQENGFAEMVFVERPTQFGHEIICRIYKADFRTTAEMLAAAETITNALNNTKK
jgi:hypothetical protein